MVRLRLAEMIKKKKLSKRQLALRLGMHYSHVFRLFRKGYDPKLSMLARIAKAIGCRIRDLFEE